MNNKKLVRQQLDASLKRFKPLLDISTPQKGWIRAIRDALGMSARQLADRMSITQQAVSRIESEENSGSITIKTMQRIAENLDCIFVYGFVPRTSLEDTVGSQAKKVALRRLSRSSQTMSLEDQSINKDENEQILAGLIEELVKSPSSDIWDLK